MIDWTSLFVNALWMIAIALALAALSFASWQAARQGQRLRIILSRASYSRIFDLAGILFCISGLFSAPATWLKLVWLALGLGFLFNFLNSTGLPMKLIKK